MPWKLRHIIRPRGFTLLELVVSMVLTTILLGALTSGMLLASRIIPDPQGPTAATTAANAIANQLVGDLYYAQSFTKRSADEVEFTVADRNGDFAPEKIRYRWSGSPGDPLKRKYNDAETIELLGNVSRFDLTYEVDEVTEEVASLPNESPETQFAGYENVSSEGGFRVTADRWIGHCFAPTLPADALGWRITRLRIKAKATGGSNGLTLVQIRPVDINGTPAGTVLEELPMYESDLADVYSWEEFSFSNVPWFNPDDEMCVVLKQIGKGGHSAALLYDDQGGSGLVTSFDGGATWSRDNTKSLIYHAFGTMTIFSPPEINARYFVAGVEIKLQVGTDPPVQVSASTRILNRPEVAAP